MRVYQNHLHNLDWITLLILSLVLLISCPQTAVPADDKSEELPNFIIIFTDDQGYGDLGCFGGDHIKTPHLDQMATEGMKLHSFYVAASVCSPSRAALMTGCYPKRINMADGVLLASDPKGLHPDEITIAEVLQSKGYATACFGKWHLGDQPEFLPTRQGFDDFFGLPYSHDIHPWHRNNQKYNFPDLPLLEGEKVIELNPDMNLFTQRITDRAIAFIKKNNKRPFFLYLPHPLPHRPVYSSPIQMKSASDSIQAALAREDNTVNYALRDQLYPQAVATIDESVGEIMKALIEQQLGENTLIIFSSDNGPARGGMGSTGDMRGRKGETHEGGMRMASLAWWPGKIEAGSSTNKVISTIDLLPTFANLARAKLPEDRRIDGRDIWSVLSSGEQKSLPERPFYYYRGNNLEAVRYGDWKYHRSKQGTFLYNLKEDIGESQNLIYEYPEVVKVLVSHFDDLQQELGKGDDLSKRCRPSGYVENPEPLTLK